jgi:hypothetical protein
VFASGALPESSYKRLQRFFAGFAVSHAQVVGFVLRHLPAGKGSWVLLMDRTNWKLGRSSINLLVVAVARGHVAIPIYWTCLAQAGASNTAQRIAALDAVLKLIDRGCIAYLLADREFIGEEWFEYLIARSTSASASERTSRPPVRTNGRFCWRACSPPWQTAPRQRCDVHAPSVAAVCIWPRGATTRASC